MAKEKIIMDVDTGSDDAIALVMSMLHPDFDLLGICSVNGNIEVKLTTDNSLRVVECCEKQDQVKVYKGCDLPMVATLTPWTSQSTGIRSNKVTGTPNPRREGMKPGPHEVHPEHLPLPEPKIKEAEISAAEFYLQTLRAAEDHSITLIPVGPLSNLAIAFRADPTVVKKVKQIVIMGGGHLMMNSSTASEFNIWVDPEAAEVVQQAAWENDVPVTWVPLDATHEAYVTVEQSKKIRDLGTKPAILVADLIAQRTDGYSQNDADMKAKGGAPLHDALAVCAVLHPEVLKNVLHTNVHIDTGKSFAYGETIVERRIRVVEEDKNAYFALGADREMFYNWIYDTLKYHKDHQTT